MSPEEWGWVWAMFITIVTLVLVSYLDLRDRCRQSIMYMEKKGKGTLTYADIIELIRVLEAEEQGDDDG